MRSFVSHGTWLNGKTRKKMQKPRKVNVSINPETMELLTKLRETLTEQMGFTPSYSQVIQYLAKEGERNEKSRA
jgi:hypothetical protein